MPATHPGMEPSPGADPGLLPYRGRVTAVCDGRAPAQAMAVVSASRTDGVSVLTPVLSVLGGSRTRTVSDLDAAPPTNLGYEDVEPPPGADPGHPHTRAEPQPCAAA
jgi:hypothetical protein